MEHDNFTEQPPQPEQKRPQLLTVLCILTFIFTGLSTLGAILFSIPGVGAMAVTVFKTNPAFNAEQEADTVTLLQAGTAYYLVMLLLNILALTGAVFMWNLKKNGFHFYTIATIGMFYMPILWLGFPFSLAGAFLSSVFVLLYGMHLKIMK